MPDVEAKERVERQLQEAIDRLRADLVRIELWACALNGFSRPIPDYQPAEKLTRHLMPRGSDLHSATAGEHATAGQDDR
jgi:hypothetical protein